MHLPLASIPSVPVEPKKEDIQNAEDDNGGSHISVESPQDTVVADPDQATPIKVHGTELFLKELESLRSLVMSLHHLQMSMRQENLDTRELLMQRMSAITEDVQAIKGQHTAMNSSPGKAPCPLKVTKANERYGTYDARADLVSNYLRGMDEASRVSSPISYRGDCRTANTFDAFPPVLFDHTQNSLSIEKMPSPLLEHCMAPRPRFAGVWPLFEPAARLNTESFQGLQVRFHNDTQGRVAQDSLESVVYEKPSVIETSGAPDGISAGTSKPQLHLAVPPVSPHCDHFDSDQDQTRSLRSRSPSQRSRPPIAGPLHSRLSSPSIPAAPLCSLSVRSISPDVNDLPYCRKPFLLRPIPRNPSRGRAPTRGGSIANTRSRSRSRSRHSVKQRSPGVAFYHPKALSSSTPNQGSGLDVMPRLLSATLPTQRSWRDEPACVVPAPVSDRSYSPSRSMSRSRSGESYRMRMRNLYPVGSPDRSSRNSSVITKNTQIDAVPHLSSPRPWTQSLAHGRNSPRFGTFVRARSSSQGSSRRSVSSCGARLFAMDRPTGSLNPSLRSVSVPARRSLIETSPLITRRSLTPSTFRSASPTADSPMTPPRMGLSLHPLNQNTNPPSDFEHGQQCSAGSLSDAGESCPRVFDSPLGLDTASPLVPTYTPIDISPNRMSRASFPSKQIGPLGNESFPAGGPATISENSLGLVPNGEEEGSLRHSDSAMMDLVTRMQSQINDLTKEVSHLKNTPRRSTPPTASVSGSTVGIIPPTPYIIPLRTLPPPLTTLEIPHPPPLPSTSPIPPPPVSYGGFSYSGAPLHPNTATPAQPHPAASFDRSAPFSGRTLKLGADAPPITASIRGPAATSAFSPIPSDPNVAYSNLPTNIPHFEVPYPPLDLNRPDPSARSRHPPISRHFGRKFDSPRFPYAPNTSHPRFSNSGLNIPGMTPDLLHPWFPVLPSAGPPMPGTFEPFRHGSGLYGQPMLHPDIHPTSTRTFNHP